MIVIFLFYLVLVASERVTKKDIPSFAVRKICGYRKKTDEIDCRGLQLHALPFILEIYKCSDT